MSLTTGEMSAADLAAVVGTNRNDGFGFGGEGGWWLILLFLIFGNGWGNGFGGNGGGVNGIDGWDDAYEQFFLTLEWTT